MLESKGLNEKLCPIPWADGRYYRLLMIVVCIMVLTGFMNISFRGNNLYAWIEDMTTCPKPDLSHYPKQNPNAVALFNKTVEADKSMPLDEIVKLYQQAAQLGHWQAMHNLAISYYQGDGIEEDEEKALYWFKEIEKLGIPEGYGNMALVYRKGIGVPIDPDKSRAYMIKAAQAGDLDSLFYLGQELYGQQLQNAFYKSYALKLWQCAADQGHKEAHFFLATHYEDRAPTTAYNYYLRGAKAGDGGCIRALYNAYAHTSGFPTFNLNQDIERAMCFYKLNEKVRNNPELTFPDLDTLCPSTLPQPNEIK